MFWTFASFFRWSRERRILAEFEPHEEGQPIVLVARSEFRCASGPKLYQILKVGRRQQRCFKASLMHACLQSPDNEKTITTVPKSLSSRCRGGASAAPADLSLNAKLFTDPVEFECTEQGHA
jgi:hypothetical protein